MSVPGGCCGEVGPGTRRTIQDRVLVSAVGPAAQTEQQNRWAPRIRRI